MSYRIEYDGRIDRYEIVHEGRSRFFGFLTAAIALFLLLTHVFWVEGADYLRTILIPGDDLQTVQAFHNLTADLRAGAGIRDAVFTFCHSVIYGQ